MDRGRGKNITAKILALFMAVVLWLYVTNEQNPPIEVSLTVPLEVRNVTSPLSAVDAPDSVRVKVRGPRGIIAGLQPRDIKTYLDMRGLAEGRHNVKVHAQVPVSLELAEIAPDTLQVRLDAAVSRKLPVEIRVTGTATTGVVVAKAAANLEQIAVEGPRSMVEAVDKAVLPLNLTGRNADFTVGVTPVLLNKDGKEIEGLIIYPDKVNISANLVRGLNQKTVDVKPVIYGELNPGAVLRSIVTKPAKIELNGDPQVLDKIDFVYTEPINIAGIDRDTVKEAKLQIKEGIIASQSTVTVHVSVGAFR